MHLVHVSRLIECQAKKDYDYPVGPMMLAFFVFVVIGSGMFPIQARVFLLPCIVSHADL